MLISLFMCLVSYKGLVAEALRQLVGEHGYKQDEVLPPGYYTGMGKYLRDVHKDPLTPYSVRLSAICTVIKVSKRCQLYLRCIT